MAQTGNGLLKVDAVTLRQWLDGGQALLLDVRERREYEARHIPGAVLTPLSSFDPAAVTVGPDQRLVVSCQSGMRAGDAARRLIKAGHQTVWCFEGSLEGWLAAGYATEASAPTGDVTQPACCGLSVQRQMQLTVGTMSLIFTLLAGLVNHNLVWLLLVPSGGLLMAGSTGFCPLVNVITKLPWNRS
jgi:rhodanese-related sulfurtransferase